MSERFFISSTIDGESAALSGPEAHHLSHVLRAKVGDVVTLFDGSGSEFTARVQKIAKQHVEFVIEERRKINRESATSLTLAVALPKGDRQRCLIEKAVELGVSRLVPLLTNRGVAQPVDSALDRLKRAVIEASKQCGRNRLMEIANPCDLNALIENSKSISVRLFAHLGGQSLSELQKASHESREIIAAIGPEGGFTDEELATAISGGWTKISLGPRILRIETAAIAIAAWTSLT
jgi:16S rRNA (uracil1498-N3)-methyltransferase